MEINSKTEIVTPHKLHVAILIKEYCLYRILEESESFIEDDIPKATYRRDFCVLLLKLLQSPDLNLTELKIILSSGKNIMHPSFIETFDKSLHTMYTNGIGAMLDIIESLNHLLSSTDHIVEGNTIISKSSVVGYFFRRLMVNFDTLTFSELTAVFSNFTRQYEIWKKSQDSDASTIESDVCTLDDWSGDRQQWTRRQSELFIATQAALLTNNEEKALPPVDLQTRITHLLKSNPSLSEAHFLSYLNYLRVKEFCGAVYSLHHCFDRGAIIDKKTPPEDQNKIYRFATLNMAILLYHFGHKEEALSALKETIKISQGANDNVCLQHTLSWLYRLSLVNKDNLIQHSVSKSFDLNLSYTASLGVQTFVQHACLNAGPPERIFDVLIESDIINCEHNLRDLISNSFSVKSALWQYYGKTEMSSLWSQLLFYLNIDNVNDSQSFYCEGFCLAICNMANHLLIQGNYALVNAIVSFAKDRFPNNSPSYVWMLCENLYLFTRALYHENWNDAELAAQKILVVNKWEGYLRLAELYYYKQDYSEAHRFVQIITTRFHSNPKYKLKRNYYIRSLILLAEIQFSSTYPDGISPGIMTLLNDCLIKTSKCNLDYYTGLIHLHIAHIQLHLGLTSQALRILDKCLITVLSQAGHFDRARAVLLYVKCIVANSQSASEDEQRNISLQAAEMLENVKDNFKTVEAYSRVKDVLCLQANLYNNINRNSDRNRCAREFRILDEERKTKNYTTLTRYL